MNVGEYGVLFEINVNFDIGAATSLTLNFTKPDNTTLSVSTPNVTPGATTISTPFGQFLANQYAVYRFVQGNVDQAGVWKVRLVYNDATQHLISDVATFSISA